MKKLYLLLLIGALSLIILENASAAGIVGISPGNINFKNVLRGGYAERYITVTSDSDELLNIRSEARGDIESWIEFPELMNVSRENPARILISVKPPTDVPNGNYSGFLRVFAESTDQETIEGKAVSTVRAVLDVAITIEITDLEILQCSAQNFRVQSAEKGDDVVFLVDILNEGNVRINPEVQIDIWDQDQISVIKSEQFRSKEILPTKEDTQTFAIETDDLELSQFWADVTIPSCFASETLTFDVLEPGALKAEGILLRITGKVFAAVGETIPIFAEFKNVGEKQVEARFEGQITRDGEIVQVIKTETIGVPIDEITSFTHYFTPERQGRYVVSGRVFYDKKKTFESSTVINVESGGFGIKQFLKITAYLAIALVIIILLSKIRKEKRRYLGV